MSSIGPQLPPHLSKRKRTPEDDDRDPPPSPPTKNPRTQGPRANQDEIDLDGDSDSEGGYGPKPVAGPTMPPGNKDEVDLASDSGSDADVGPAPPLPAEEGESSDDDDDDFGPALPTAATKPKIGPSLPPSEAEGGDAPQRDAWMLAPPPSGGPFTERDTTKIRTRKFASKPGAASSSQQPSSIWTETPEEKLKRLQDSVLGRSGPKEEGNEGAGRSKEAEERDRKIAANIEAQRGRSLYEEHSQRRRDKGTGQDEEDDPSKRGFDREKDMAVGGGLGAAQRKDLVNKSANFGGRFQKGSYL